MNKLQQYVLRFHEMISAYIADKPHLPNSSVRKSRILHIQEELFELNDAWAKGDLVETADGLADLLFVVLGAAISLGIDIDPIFEEISRSNMTKTKGYWHNGKWMKGETYDPPVLNDKIKHWDDLVGEENVIDEPPFPLDASI